MTSKLCHFCLLILFLAIGQAFSQDVTNDEIQRQAEKKYISKSKKIIRFFNHVTIPEDEIIDGNVIVIKGDLNVDGEIKGDVVAVMGDVTVNPSGKIRGDVTSVGGKIFQELGGRIEGNQVETSWANFFGKDVSDRPTRKRYREITYSDQDQRPLLTTIDYQKRKNFVLAYNRVDGIFLGFNLPKYEWSIDERASLYGFAGYAFKGKGWRYQIGLARRFFNEYSLEISANVHDLTDTKDDWYITDTENSLYAFLIHEDHRDYFQRQGYSFAVTQELNRYVKGGLEFRRDFYDSLQTNTDWALFGGNKKFRNNPFVDVGDMSSLVGMLVIDTRDNIRHTMRGTYFSLEGETSSSGLGGDFSFNRYIVDVRKYFELSRRENLDFRLRVGTTEGNVPIQKSFTLGGIGSLRGYNLKEFTGNRMVLGTVEYRVGLFRHGFMDFFDRLILFVDSGRAWDSFDNRKGTNGFDLLKFDFLKTDAGIGFSNESGSFRVDLARRTDVKDSHLNVFLRINRPF